ncbi:hypothetical protein CEP52_016788 [Fusarium oligoseptatum]|uniref:CHAT domain-containing protein n=1 Tax=Fusarium oligoseptatum TaxID=2604345 RepID=A0A428S003_9HYPO|nr:hypothetical protein CEP52_016788 [Fusarium oligoseptatum]
MSPAGGSSANHLATCTWEITVAKCLWRRPVRKWVVNVDEPGRALRSIELEDPDDSRSYTEHDSFLSSPDARIRSERVDDDTRQTRIQTYCASMGRQLGLDEMTDLRNKKGTLKIYVRENVHESERCSIHGLRWELLEHSAFTCGYTIQVTRICSGFRPNDLCVRGYHHQTPARVLLVVARSWQLSPPTPHSNDHYADLSPDLVHQTLSTATTNLTFSSSSFQRVKAETVAKLLQEYQVKLVALSSCQSAYAQNGPISNLCHILLKHGVDAVTAMAFTVRGESFSSASAFGRAHVRKHDDEPLGLFESEPSALPGAYRRARTDSAEWGNLRLSASNRKHIESDWMAIAQLLSLILICFVKWRRTIGLRLWVPFALLILYIILHHKSGRSINLQAPQRGLEGRGYCPSQSQKEFLRRLRSEPSESSEMAFGRTVLEDQLAEHHNVFIQLESSPMSPKQKRDLEYAVDVWKLTEFVDDVTFVKSEQLTSPAWYYKECMKRNIFSLSPYLPWATSCKIETERTGKWDGKGVKIRASMIILTDFDYLFEDHQRGNREMALSRVSSLRNWLSKTQIVYLVFIGNADVPWESGDINPDDHPWVQGRKLFANRDLGMVGGGWGV